jgi:hypothetical protein
LGIKVSLIIGAIVAKGAIDRTGPSGDSNQGPNFRLKHTIADAPTLIAASLPAARARVASAAHGR